MQKIDTRWFQDRLTDKKLSQRKLASLLNLDPAAVSLMLRGRRKMSAAEAAEVARVLGVPVKDVLVRAGVYAAADSAMAEAAMARHQIYLAQQAAEPPKTPEQRAEEERLSQERHQQAVRARFEHAKHELARIDPTFAVEASGGPAEALGGTDMVEVPVPMANGAMAVLRLPKGMGKGDAQRIAAVVQALALP